MCYNINAKIENAQTANKENTSQTCHFPDLATAAACHKSDLHHSLPVNLLLEHHQTRRDNGLFIHQSGRILIDSMDISTVSTQALRSRVVSLLSFQFFQSIGGRNCSYR